MTALDFSAYDQAEDSPELAAFKERVKKVAYAYKRRYGMCTQVDNGLRELGIPAPRVVATVKVQTTVGFEFEVKVDPSDYKDLSEEEQTEKILGRIAEMFPNSRMGRFTIAASAIESMEVVPPNAASTGDTDELVVWLDTNGGRTAHAFHRRVVDNRHQFETLSSACGLSMVTWEVHEDAENSRCGNCARMIAAQDSSRALDNMLNSRTRGGDYARYALDQFEPQAMIAS